MGIIPVGDGHYDEIIISFERRTNVPDNFLARTQFCPENVVYTFVREGSIIQRETRGTFAYNPHVTIQYNYHENEIMLRLHWQGDDGRPIEEHVTADRLTIKAV